MATNNSINNTLGAATATSLAFSPTTNGLIGTPTNNNVVAGSVGEFVTSVIAAGSAVSLTNVTAADITSISLTAGDWDVWGNTGFLVAASSTTIGYMIGWIGTTSATIPDPSLYSSLSPNSSQTYVISPVFTVPGMRLSLSTTTTIYLSCIASFAVSTLGGFGGIYARRRR